MAAGVLTHGHAPPESLDGILELLKTDGIVIFSMSAIAHDEYGFKQKMDVLEKNRQWKKLDQSRLFRTYPFSEKEAHLRHWVFVYQKTTAAT